MDSQQLTQHIAAAWRDSVIPRLVDYIAIPAKSPLFDPDWDAHGYIDRAVALAMDWARKQPITGMALEGVRLPRLTPTLLIDIPAFAGAPLPTPLLERDIKAPAPKNVLIYGHLDKQPEMTGWREGLGPWQPVIEDGKLYGRGGADDGYAIFSALSAIAALQAQNMAHPRCVVLIETSEESGSPDLPAYMQALSPRIGTPDLVIALDSGCGDYARLWSTASLRGMVGGALRVQVLTEGVHSGDASGVVPSSFRIARQLLSRIEDETSGRILPPEFHAPIPEARERQAAQAAQILGRVVHEKFPFHGSTQPMERDLTQLVLNRAWRPTLSVTGADGLPPLNSAGNVLRPNTDLKLSLRLPPTVDASAAADRLKQILERDPPHGATVNFDIDQAATGWSAPELAPWLAKALTQSSQHHFDKAAGFLGEGVTIPFMSMLGQQYPQAQFVITGVLGPHSNAHGPNEFLDLDYAQKLTCCVAEIIAAVK
ncbi:MAG: M20/M25/M40 family metallo-hydrolase [Burkholderiales bacterium]|nr:M20/M25/M40 family metallo-hydrolase [Burkholderiales bacterium]